MNFFPDGLYCCPIPTFWSLAKQKKSWQLAFPTWRDAKTIIYIYNYIHGSVAETRRSQADCDKRSFCHDTKWDPLCVLLLSSPVRVAATNRKGLVLTIQIRQSDG